MDLSVEALVLHPAFLPLFSEEERQMCCHRLEQCGYKEVSESLFLSRSHQKPTFSPFEGEVLVIYYI